MDLLLGYSLKYNGGKVLANDKGIKLGPSDSKVLGALLRDVDGIILGIDVGTELGYLNGYIYVTNYGKIEGIFPEGSLGSTDTGIY